MNDIPVILHVDSLETDSEKFQLNVSSDAGSLFIDGYGDGIWISGEQPNTLINSTAFGILQAKLFLGRQLRKFFRAGPWWNLQASRKLNAL